MLLKLRVLILTVPMSLLPATVSFADQEAGPIPYVVASPGTGTYYFKMVPEGDREAGGKGYAYIVGRDKDELLYETSGWYSYRVLLSGDSRYICRVGNSGRIGDWYFEQEGSGLKSPHKWVARSPKEHVALAFYDKGMPIKTYYVTDLVSDLGKLHFSMSHYIFFKNDVRFYYEALSDAQRTAMGIQDSHSCWIVAQTVDDQTHVFNMRTGERVGGADLARALAMTEEDARTTAAAHLKELGPEWKGPGNCEHAGDFLYAFGCRFGEENRKLLIDRRTGKVSIKP